MEEFEQQFQASANYHSDQMKEKRKNFENMPSFIKAGLYYAQKFKEMHYQQVQQKYFASDLLKLNGNQKYKNSDYESACKFYEQALSVFRFVRTKREDWRNEGLYDEDLEYIDENGKNDKEKKLVKGLKVILYQNVCLVYLKLSKNKVSYANDALQACNEAIKLDQKSSKAFYLRAKSRLHKATLNNEDFKLSIKDYKKALELDPENPNIYDELQKCMVTFDRIKQNDNHQQPNISKQQTQTQERITTAEPNNSSSLNGNANRQNKEKSKNQTKSQSQVLMEEVDKRQQQQNKREINDQNRKAQEIWNQLRLDKNYQDLNFDLQYEVVQKTVI